MLSLEFLERAAESLAMPTSRERTSLRVGLLKGTELTLFDEVGGRTQSLHFGGVPSWAFAVLTAFASFAGGMFFVLYARLDRTTYVLFLIFLFGGVGASFVRTRVERARERLNDRAYQLAKSSRSGSEESDG
jgi:hypothetical protein